MKQYDVVVVGAGHAGCEAALACARMGLKTAIFTLNLDSIANMPCNPSIGGTAKGHLVREIDALGGQIGKCADATLIQSKMLNRSGGPAVYSLRAQIDRRQYQTVMKHMLEKQENLDIRQYEITDIIFDNNSGVTGVVTNTDVVISAKAVIIATGTYMKSRIIIGDMSYEGGPDGFLPANRLSLNLEKKGIKLRRFKTGTPARVHKNSIDLTKMSVQNGDEPIVPFSFETDKIEINQIPCYLTYTNEKTHDIIRKNLDRSPLYSGKISGTGVRYCPSIEDKIVKFADKERHQVFLEPMGLMTDEMYVQGMSSSMPEDVQEAMYKSVKGMENVVFMRSAYAIEYDCFDPLQLMPTLEFKKFPGLYSAGQSNGSSGYEEAAAQGIMAGINAALKIKKQSSFVLDRSEAYIGVLIDDLVTKGTNEPYRMMTSRAEYRLILRQDNADERLTPKGYKLGLISEERYTGFLRKMENIEKEIERLKKKNVSPKIVNPFLEKRNQQPLNSGTTEAAILKREGVGYNDLYEIDDEIPELTKEEREQVEIKIKYEGYIEKQQRQIEQFKKMEKVLLSENIDYKKIKGLRNEAQQKLDNVKPVSLGMAGRISGVSPADIQVLYVYIEQQKRKKRKAKE
ncbi:MAG TPA: tRNA uridine-5-carboxymethylaminomethyl(34) synthesis enzyme MnmG [Clostridia bacterium]|jgi:tRNA uridine 5-carboxymethylaminomethyl modification enzyme|nr:tRNA uridine-5-carboxymethylaminomethyl(34) synthesis enzyme MnmG [Clostridiaceae bacterium]HOM35237.1 tRNA uridine-5-carboxymethylaminomethyl(34) synthesis enzyme MnmG [Clostridia bacterium]HOT70061.1 tRNA uridine-5-carboxymethylaminomethyl(34) synthesis enzyme MnmG [Clostridia bacterium]HQF99348.1 tRNA uridine-5-carboxymethylaminomethyl(34) synthesis enzyme MnmG [Clostridia bacterium]HQH65610.1 tRNA uridine-5-carboxymethylaminomethyl(34) synthesis enzyme MnmG [Clostridia bacterium]